MKKQNNIYYFQFSLNIPSSNRNAGIMYATNNIIAIRKISKVKLNISNNIFNKSEFIHLKVIKKHSRVSPLVR